MLVIKVGVSIARASQASRLGQRCSILHSTLTVSCLTPLFSVLSVSSRADIILAVSPCAYLILYSIALVFETLKTPPRCLFLF